MLTNERRAVLCVADGCGGLGSRRYPDLKDQTGAYVASRLIIRFIKDWAAEKGGVPVTPEQGRALLDQLEQALHNLLKDFAKKNGMMDGNGRIVGSMQRILPSTLCMMIDESSRNDESCCFLWAGDSRGYVLDSGGLKQYTQDDLRSPLDAFDCLYCDSPLSNCLSADQPIRLHMRRMPLSGPAILICASDGAYGCLPTPMEFEMLLLSTLRAAESADSWQSQLRSALSKLANDDATILCCSRGFESFAKIKAYFAPRLETLKASWILPVRHSGHDKAIAREKWEGYRTAYDHTKEVQSGQNDWRL